MYNIFKSDPNKSLRYNILRGFIPITVISLLVSAGVLIALVAVTNNTATTESESALTDQIIRQAEAVSSENSKLLDQKLTRYLQGGVSPVAHATTDTTRTGYSQEFLPSYFDFNPDPPLTTDSRHRIPVSFSHSTYYFPGTDESSIPTFTKEQNQTRDNSTHLDNFFIPIYINYRPLVQSYVGYESNGMFRRYPGNFTQDRTYDPRQRGWYIDAKGSSSGYTVSDPYQDFNILEWMITIGEKIYDNFGTFLGVSGADITIESLREIIESVSFLDTGKVSIFQTDGVVVADQEWPMERTNPVGYTYSDLQNPRVYESTWESISSTETDQTKVFEFSSGGDDYYAITTHLDSFDEKYLVTVFIKKSEITEPIEPTINELQQSGIDSIIILVVIAVCVSLLVALIIYATAQKIVVPLDDASKNLDTMVMGLGGPPALLEIDDSTGIEMENTRTEFVRVGSGLGSEAHEFADKNRKFAEHLEEERRKAINGKQEPNDLFNGKNKQLFVENADEEEDGEMLPVAYAFPVDNTTVAQVPNNTNKQQYQRVPNNTDVDSYELDTEHKVAQV